jgi:hypothetical protein
LRWLEEVENELRELKMMTLRQKPSNREECGYVVKESSRAEK